MLLSVLAAGCVGAIGVPPGSPPGGTGAPGGSLDVGRVAVHRLNSAEYDNTVFDLLGVRGSAATTFIPDEKALGFDTIADAFTMGDARFEQYFNAADILVEQALADPGLRARILTCAPAAPGDAAACTRAIVQSFGLRAWRRPLNAAEVDSLIQLGSDALALGEDFAGSVKQVVKTLLMSAQFLYRVEIDPQPASAVAHPLDGYELASRLSYLLWSSMPDARLFELAGAGRLQDDAVLAAEVDRLLADPRGASFVSSFAGQWLGLRDLASHQVEASAFPDWNESLRQSMLREGLLYFSEFLGGAAGGRNERSLAEFFTADVNFADARLAALYGIAGPAAAASEPVRVVDLGDQRRGFLGLASFLTVTSYSYRTAPTLRGKWVLENLLCQTIPAPPPNIPKLDDGQAGSAATQSLNIRQRLAEHRANPLCASCHDTLDPIGLGLESFDAIGRYRAVYANGDAVDASGVLPDGSRFNGIQQLSALLSADARFTDCASQKLMTYALSRRLGDADAPFIQQARVRWKEQGLGLRALIQLLVASPTFRQRHGQI